MYGLLVCECVGGACVCLQDEEHRQHWCKWSIMEDALSGILSNSWNVTLRWDKTEAGNWKERLRRQSTFLARARNPRLWNMGIRSDSRGSAKVLSLRRITVTGAKAVSSGLFASGNVTFFLQCSQRVARASFYALNSKRNVEDTVTVHSESFGRSHCWTFSTCSFVCMI